VRNERRGISSQRSRLQKLIKQLMSLRYAISPFVEMTQWLSEKCSSERSEQSL